MLLSATKTIIQKGNAQTLDVLMARAVQPLYFRLHAGLQL